MTLRENTRDTIQEILQNVRNLHTDSESEQVDYSSYAGSLQGLLKVALSNGSPETVEFIRTVVTRLMNLKEH